MSNIITHRKCHESASQSQYALSLTEGYRPMTTTVLVFCCHYTRNNFWSHNQVVTRVTRVDIISRYRRSFNNVDCRIHICKISLLLIWLNITKFMTDDILTTQRMDIQEW